MENICSIQLFQKGANGLLHPELLQRSILAGEEFAKIQAGKGNQNN